MSRLDALLDLLVLGRLPRTGWAMAGIQAPESVAAHSLGTSLIALALGPEVEPPLDVDRAASLCTVHDAPEAWLGDIPRRGARLLGEEAKGRAESEAARGLLAPLSALAGDRFAEFQAGETREARFARLCDKLQLGVSLLGYARAGARGLGEFRRGLERLDCSEFGPCQGLHRAILEAFTDLDRCGEEVR